MKRRSSYALSCVKICPEKLLLPATVEIKDAPSAWMELPGHLQMPKWHGKWQSDWGSRAEDFSTVPLTNIFSLPDLELSPPTISAGGFGGLPCAKGWCSTDGNLQTIPSAHAHNFCLLWKVKGLAHSDYFAELNTLVFHVYSWIGLWPNKICVSKQ